VILLILRNNVDLYLDDFMFCDKILRLLEMFSAFYLIQFIKYIISLFILSILA